MNHYIRISDLFYPFSEGLVKGMHQNTSFPSPFVPPGGFALVFPAPQPAYDAVTQGVRETQPELTSLGTWEQRWEVVELFALPEDKAAAVAAAEASKEASKAAQARSERGDKLAASDWTQLVDAPVVQAPWATYRQALRDVPLQAGFPSTITWPVQP